MVFPDSVETLGDDVFFYCKSLRSVTIPKSVSSIGNNVYKGCSNVTTFVEEGSYAEAYCREAKLRYKIIKE